MITDAIIEDIKKIYGAPIEYDANERMTLFNEQFFAELFRRCHSPVYLPAEKQFLIYDDKTGLWTGVSDALLIHKLGLFLHECALSMNEPQIEKKRTCATLRNIKTFLNALAEQSSFFASKDGIFIHCANGILEWNADSGDWEKKPFSEKYRSRNRCELNYNSTAECPRFLNELLRPLMDDHDIELLQQYLGQCLLGSNISQTFLLLTGPGGGGKSTLCNIIELIIGRQNCSQLRPEHVTGRFEFCFFVGKTLLTGKESASGSLLEKGMARLKELTGDDTLRAEFKGSNQHTSIQGRFNVIITGNAIPQLRLDNDEGAWRRRVRWINCKHSKPETVIRNFDEHLVATEGSGILNWIMEGAKKLLLNGRVMPCSEKQNSRIDYLIGSADPLDLFLDICVECNRGTTITNDEMFGAFSRFCKEMDLPLWNQRQFQNRIPDAMLKRFQIPLRRDVPRPKASSDKKTNRAGFFHVQFRKTGFEISVCSV